jgi:hypothetical protein
MELRFLSARQVARPGGVFHFCSKNGGCRNAQAKDEARCCKEVQVDRHREDREKQSVLKSHFDKENY